MNDTTRPRINPDIVLRQESDDWALLYDPETGSVFGLHPVSVLVCGLLDGRHTIESIIWQLRLHCSDVPDDPEEHIRDFIDDLVSRGLATY